MKGLSQIISATIILAVGVSMASLYAEWAPNFAGEIVGDVANQTNNEIRCSNAAIDVRDAVYDKTGQVVDFDIENTGTIRLSKGITAGAFNSSNEINRTSIDQLDVGETHSVSITSSKIPDSVLVTSIDCPSIKENEDSITVQR